MISRRELLSVPFLIPAFAEDRTKLTVFQIACMTLPYSAFSLERALEGIRSSGYRSVAWGTTHRDSSGAARPVLAVDSPSSEAAQLARRCRDMGLEPVMMFSTVFLESPDASDGHLRRIEQAAAAKIPFVLTFGRTRPGEYQAFVNNLKTIAPRAESSGVTIVIKQHGGNTATGQDCARILADVGHPSIKICYDAGNVLDYENHDPLPDIQTCWRDIRAFAIKDHRNTPKDEDCAPGFGEIDHYKLLTPVLHTGLTMPLACENIFEPLRPRPSTPEGIDTLARRSREYLESVIAGLQGLTSSVKG
jgi:sugar phosphate isomerase/epimerase